MVISGELLVRVGRALLAAVAETQRRGTQKVGTQFILYPPVKQIQITTFDLIESGCCEPQMD